MAGSACGMADLVEHARHVRFGCQSERSRAVTRDCCRFDTTGKTLLLFINDAICPAHRAKIFVFPKERNYDLKKPSRARYGGRFAIVTKRGAGCDGRIGIARRARSMRTVKPCGPDSPTLESSLLR